MLGFKNKWYAEGMANAEEVTLADGMTIKAFSVPYLIASKLEAFRDRGRGDYMASPDIEDIVALLDGCPDVEKRLAEGPATVKSYLAKETDKLLANERFLDGLAETSAPGPAEWNASSAAWRSCAGSRNRDESVLSVR